LKFGETASFQGYMDRLAAGTSLRLRPRLASRHATGRFAARRREGGKEFDFTFKQLPWSTVMLRRRSENFTTLFLADR